jgi:PEP-CTERM motif
LDREDSTGEDSIMLIRLCGVAALGAGLICVDVISTANAALITYAFDPGTSFVFPDGGAGDLTGTFTLNEGNFTGDNVVVTGGIEAGTYTPSGSGIIFLPFTVALTYGSSVPPVLFAVQLHAVGFPNVDFRTLVLDDVTWEPMSGMEPQTALDVTGGATLIPEPSTWAMMLLGFVGLGLAALRRWRRTNLSNLSA